MRLQMKTKVTRGIFFSGIFLVLVLFYTKIAPLVIFNMDDWHYLVLKRGIFPKWGGWNPTRILPEILMPLAAQGSALMIYPFTGYLVSAFEMGAALTVSLMVTVYAYLFFRLAIRKYKVSDLMACSLTLLFLLLHFVIFRTQKSNNDYLLTGHNDTTTFFFYLIPALWNLSLVMYFIAEDYFAVRKTKKLRVRAAVMAAVYFGLFSNLFQSAVLAIYTLVDLIFRIAHQIRKRKRARSDFAAYWFHLTIIVLWVLSLVFEVYGGRSDRVGAKDMETFVAQAGSAFAMLIARLRDVNSTFLIFSICTIVCALISKGILLMQKKKKTANPMISSDQEAPAFLPVCLITSIIILVYLWLLSAKSVDGYIQRGDVLIGSLVFLFLVLLDILMRLLMKHSRMRMVLPFLLLVFFSQTYTGDITWKAGSTGYTPATERNITKDIVDQYIKADLEGAKITDIEVPIFADDDNWPIALYGSNRISETLYQYGVISRKIKTTFTPVKEKNKQFHISVPKKE